MTWRKSDCSFELKGWGMLKYERAVGLKRDVVGRSWARVIVGRGLGSEIRVSHHKRNRRKSRSASFETRRVSTPVVMSG